MRSFQLLYLVMFFLFYLLLSVGAIFNVKVLVTNKKKNLFIWVMGIFQVLVLAGFVFLYIYPNQPQHATNYPTYFYYNALLFLVVLFNIPTALSYLACLIAGRKKRILPFTGLILATGIGLGLVYGVFAEKNSIKTSYIETEFANLPPSFHNFRVVQISDIHIGSMLKSSKLLKKTSNEIKKLKPDLILFTGDLVNNYAIETEGFENFLREMTVNSSGYSILGNHDYGDYTKWEDMQKKQENLKGIVSKLNETGFRLLRNESTVIKQGTDSIFLAGVENWGHPPFPQYANLEKAINKIPGNAFTILMTHDPAHWESKIKGKENIELTLAGHTHGFQWGIKLGGIPFSMAFMARKYWGGLYQYGNSFLYVNTGLGTVGIPWRIDMKPEITVFRLKRSKID